MKASDLRLALAIAQDATVDLRAEFDAQDVMFGFGCADFQPTAVSLRVVAACIRWQCNRFDGTFDWHQFNEDRPHYLRKEITIAEPSDAEMRTWLVNFVMTRLVA